MGSAVVQLRQALPPRILALLADDARSPASCADQVFAALSAEPRFAQLLEALTDASCSPCAKDSHEAADLSRQAADALQASRPAEAAELCLKALLLLPGGASSAAARELFALRSRAHAALAATRSDDSHAGLEQASERDARRARATSPEALLACDASEPAAPLQPLPELYEASGAPVDAASLQCASPRVQCRESAGAGRGLHATQSLPAGAALLCEPPFVLAVHKPQRTTRCHACLARLPRDVLPCRGCSAARFCGSRCESAAASGAHGLSECGGAAWAAALPTEAVLAARLATKLSLDGDAGTETVRELVWHWHGGAVGVDERAERCVLAAVLSRCCGQPPAALLRAMLVLRSNCFAVLDEWTPDAWCGAERAELRVGAALYATSSLVNHSCAPNAHASFSAGGALVLRTTSALAAGEELHISYGPQAGQEGRTMRRKLLAASHAFSCACAACAAPGCAEALLLGLRCLADASCTGALSPSPRAAACDTCGLSAPAQHAEAVARLRVAQAEMRKAVERGALEAARARFAEILEFAHAQSRHAAEGWDLLAQCLNVAGGQAGVRDALALATEAAEASAASLAVLRVHYPPCSLPLAHELAKAAELWAAAGRGEESRGAAEEAAGILRAAYGDAHPRLAELARLLEAEA